MMIKHVQDTIISIAKFINKGILEIFFQMSLLYLSKSLYNPVIYIYIELHLMDSLIIFIVPRYLY